MAANASASGIATNKAVGENVLTEIDNEEVEVEVPKRLRGKTKMDRVHTRTFDERVVIQMNHKGQPISDDDKVMAELSSFLGTLKMSVSLTYKSRNDVPKALKDHFWEYIKHRYIIPEECKK